MRRTGIQDSTEHELDVWTVYRAPDGNAVATVYLFKTTLPDPSLWFDRALTAMAAPPGGPRINRDTASVTQLRIPGGAMPSGLAAVLALPSGDAATGLALTAVGNGVLAKIRYTAVNASPDDVRSMLDRIVGAIGWPEAENALPATQPIAECRRPLRLGRARVLRPGGADVLMSGVLAGEAAVRVQETETWCREPGATLERGLYRAGGSRNSYVLALYDSGLALSLAPQVNVGAFLAGDTNAANRYVAMTLYDRTQVAILPGFDRLPLPEQAIEVSGFGVPSVSTTDSR
jgi:hypothetical protein